MAKLNVNMATREELVEAAGLRPDLADAILKFRGKHGGKITDVNALEELSGVGPATIEQLRKALDFSERKTGGQNGQSEMPATAARGQRRRAPTPPRNGRAGNRDGGRNRTTDRRGGAGSYGRRCRDLSAAAVAASSSSSGSPVESARCSARRPVSRPKA